ncbi:unnamed protein product [Clavelina lepadiformis]|uniref:IRS-type PTB domain-containing protein n=1 Tax=Clavelina lepadiformis TaxID=159417 RepID=A0ABP0GVJ5_CLALP
MNSQQCYILCEGWLERKIQQATAQNDLKWKTRYARLVLQHDKFIEVQFFQKQPKQETDIVADKITLLQWRYAVDFDYESKDKGRAHIIRIQVYDHGFVTPASLIVKISLQYGDEALAWMHCIQNLTKLTSEIQGHTFNVIPCDGLCSQKIGVSNDQCVLHVTAEAVSLAVKTNYSIACVLPLSSIRSYNTKKPSHFSITSGRRAPLGEGIYEFKTAHGDGNRLFDLMDHYTGITPVAKMVHAVERPASTQTNCQNINTTNRDQAKEQEKQLPPRNPSVVSRSFPSSSNELLSNTPQKPPRKPPLPKNFFPSKSFTSFLDELGFCDKNGNSSNTVEQQGNIQQPGNDKVGELDKSSVMSRGLYDLDKLLYTLEGNILKSNSSNKIMATNGDIELECKTLLTELIENVVKGITFPDNINNADTVHAADSRRSVNIHSEVPQEKFSFESESSRKKTKSTPRPNLCGSKISLTSSGSKDRNSKYSTIDWSRKSFKQRK